MVSLFDSMMADGASPMLDEHLAEAVSITRGPNTTTDVDASWSSQKEEVSTTDAKHTKVVDRLWFVKQSAYQILSTGVEPRTGDRLTVADGRKWEVLPDGRTPSVESYAGGDYWKLTTKRVA